MFKKKTKNIEVEDWEIFQAALVTYSEENFQSWNLQNFQSWNLKNKVKGLLAKYR